MTENIKQEDVEEFEMVIDKIGSIAKDLVEFTIKTNGDLTQDDLKNYPSVLKNLDGTNSFILGMCVGELYQIWLETLDEEEYKIKISDYKPKIKEMVSNRGFLNSIQKFSDRRPEFSYLFGLYAPITIELIKDIIHILGQNNSDEQSL